jgi:transcriptional regulator with XRE-family HTH domain
MAITDMAELGAAVRDERERRGLSQAAIGQQIGVSREWVGRLENGAPRLEADKLLRMLAALDIRIVPSSERPNQQDVIQAQKVAWTMLLEAQPISDDGFNKVLDKIVSYRLDYGRK